MHIAWFFPLISAAKKLATSSESAFVNDDVISSLRKLIQQMVCVILKFRHFIYFARSKSYRRTNTQTHSYTCLCVFETQMMWIESEGFTLIHFIARNITHRKRLFGSSHWIYRLISARKSLNTNFEITLILTRYSFLHPHRGRHEYRINSLPLFVDT